MAKTVSDFESVGSFHSRFGLRVFGKGDRPPGLLDEDTFAFRLRFLGEELDEMSEAHRRGDFPGFADAIADLVYVALGTAHLAGIPFDEVFAEVQRANMTKVRANGPDDPRSRRGHHLDVVKPEGWKPPDVAGVLRRNGWKGEKVEERPGKKELSKWDQRYWDLALHAATWAKDPSTKVGAVLVGKDPRKVALGYNGFPPKIEDRQDRLQDKDVKYKLTQHAERNVLDNAEFDARGATLYVVPQAPCSECAKSIVSRGVARVVCPPWPDREPWASDSKWARLVLEEAGVSLDVFEV